MSAVRPLRILHTEASLGWGGQEIRLLTEARHFVDSGHSVHLVCDGDSDIARAAPGYGVGTTVIPLKRKSFAALRAMRRVFAEWRPDVVNSHSSIDHWLAAMARLGMARRPAVVRTRHIGAPVSRNLATRWLYNKGCEFVMTTSEAMVEALTGDGFLAPDHVAAVPTGIDTDRFCPGDRSAARRALDLPDQAFVFGIVATLRSWKGHRYLIEAFAGLGDERALLVIVGDGPQEENLRTLIGALGIEDRVRLAGRQEDVVPYLRAMDVFVLPSYENEGVPQALLQAMSCETPAIVTPVGGMPELAAGLQGVAMVAAKDAASLRDMMNKFLAAPREPVSRTGLRQRVLDRYTIEKMGARVLAVFERAIALQQRA
ncbi:MAG: glycosyltransferase [Alphaproteobacteria bacterium]|nr:glycosyltransferase [Alphaproteobacteria bacterium]